MPVDEALYEHQMGVPRYKGLKITEPCVPSVIKEGQTVDQAEEAARRKIDMPEFAWPSSFLRGSILPHIR